ncbi:MAG TPA: dTDP-4-dehydrorhamnose reductase [Solirubrobacteraceae bacterium]|jgi:dTDP-4-dehydrorhamnose reductase|nr:dTDP-4-dehydrorhamnose reductase [Solirubrobacteraceae bacterium]
MRLLVTGAAGMLGRDVARAAAAAGHDVTALARGELDVTDPDAVAAAVREARPEAVINCAAWTDVDGAEKCAEEAFAVNGPGAGNVARAAAEAAAWSVHVSTDYVFSGEKGAPYLESDPTGPRSQYGRGKLAGELAVAQAAPGRHSIVRSSWLFGAGGRCFPATILRAGSERDELTVVDDQVGCPTFTGHLGPALVALTQDPILGLVHVAGGGSCSWFQFAQEIVALAGLGCEIVPGSTAELGRPAPRPAYSVLGSERDGAPRLPEWREGLQAFLAAGVPS